MLQWIEKNTDGGGKKHCFENKPIWENQRPTISKLLKLFEISQDYGFHNAAPSVVDGVTGPG